MGKFKLGDRVRVVDRYIREYNIDIGEIGTIVVADPEITGVRFKNGESFKYGTNCTYYFTPRSLELYSSFKDTCEEILNE